MKTNELDYDLPTSAIAQFPANPRDHSRLLVFSRGSGHVEHRRFFELPQILDAQDLLVANDVRVLPAKFTLVRPSGRKFQGLFLEELLPGQWRVMLRSNGHMSVGEELTVGSADVRQSWRVRLLDRYPQEPGQWKIAVAPAVEARTILALAGEVPLPPYIEKARDRIATPLPQDLDDRISYQTVYAREPGALASPTAGLHFTPDLLRQLAERGIGKSFVTLEVGLGTFLPIRTDNVEDHRMHRERFYIPAATVEAIRRHRGLTAAAVGVTTPPQNGGQDGSRPAAEPAKTGSRSRKGRLVFVGTTAVRAVESAAAEILAVDIAPRNITGTTEIFIEPGFKFALTDALITNFHLPKSTLLAMVAALTGLEKLRELYAAALDQGYRFYSYGDAMLILP